MSMGTKAPAALLDCQRFGSAFFTSIQFRAQPKETVLPTVDLVKTTPQQTGTRANVMQTVPQHLLSCWV